MFGGIICLVGDAAHVHSPTGGQGMNLGICDSVSLARSIDKHMREAKGENPSVEVLQLYSTSRRRNAVTVIAATHNLTKVLNAPDGWRAVSRNILMRVAGWFGFFRRKAAWRLSGLEYRGQ
jgi:2-polyprenyl-6-methoxyphenol hydroxylase-like FAD-dependent oxidoreductase